MKNRKYKLFDDKKQVKAIIKDKTDEINDVRKDLLFKNSISIVSGIGSICLNVGAFGLNNYEMKTSALICGSLLGMACIGSLFAINTTEDIREKRIKIKELKLERKEIIQKFKNLDEELNKKR